MIGFRHFSDTGRLPGSCIHCARPAAQHHGTGLTCDPDAWGRGQFDWVDLGGGVRAGLHITTAGRLLLAIDDGRERREIDVTEGSALLGCGLHEAGARAAQIRCRRTERRR